MKSLKLTAPCLAALLLAVIAPLSAQTKVTKAEFGKLPDGAAVDIYTLSDATLNVRVMTFGAHLVSVNAPDRNGKVADVVLGYDTFADYLADKSTYMGSIVGRYGNRIAKGQFSVGGVKAQLPLNNNGNTLHGGTVGFDRLNWTAKQVPNGVELTVISADGDQGFPGKLTASVTYTLVGDKLRMVYHATSDKPTVVNLTNHSYFNLAGKGTILDEVAMIDADKYTPTDKLLIPTGELAPVAGTPFDFRKPTVIGARIDTPNDQLKNGGGYDHNWVLNPPHTLAHPAVVMVDPASGRTLKVFTTEPGVQFYTGNSLTGEFKGREGMVFAKNTGFCLETQHYPDSPNQPGFPSTTVTPGKPYHTSTIFEFTVTK